MSDDRERPPRRRLVLAGGATAAVVLLVLFASAGTGYTYRPFGPVAAPAGSAGDERRLAAETRALAAELRRLAPRGPYVIIDRGNNRLYLRDGERVLLDAPCSTGSGWILVESRSGRAWVFDTPAGSFVVQSKLANPWWRKPDWAFIEEQEPIPDDPRERFEAGMLGEYALDFGDGYLIHGTLYERLLGRSVTHGCVRLGRDDLRTLYGASRLGTPVLIF